jgi:hypothetical protein
MIIPDPIKRNTHPQDKDTSGIPDNVFTVPFHDITNIYPTIMSTSSPKKRTHAQDLTASNIQIIAKKINMIYAGIWRSVRGNGAFNILLWTTGDIIPVNMLTMPSNHICIRENVI